VWSVFPRDTKYFNPSRSSFMINYRVDDLEGLLEELKKKVWRSILRSKTTIMAASPGSPTRTETALSCGSRQRSSLSFLVEALQNTAHGDTYEKDHTHLQADFRRCFVADDDRHYPLPPQHRLRQGLGRRLHVHRAFISAGVLRHPFVP